MRVLDNEEVDEVQKTRRLDIPECPSSSDSLSLTAGINIDEIMDGEAPLEMSYAGGIGLEDLEGCECFFSRSNALASQIRHSSIFHRQQSIIEFMKHMDAFETSQNLSSFLVNNYHQALNILSKRQYLLGLSKEPIQETLEMDYYQKLVNYRTSMQVSPILFTSNLEALHDLERKLGVTVCWMPEMEEWKLAAALVSRHRYQWCLDELESLVVSRMFELTKMNMSQTAMLPPRQPLSWDEVVSYAFLADFDLLCDTCQDFEPKNPCLTYQIHKYRLERTCFAKTHMQRFEKLALLPDQTLHQALENTHEVKEHTAGNTEKAVLVDVPNIEEEDAESEEQEALSLEERFNAILAITY
ncbi:hypothetical protein BDQ17DRAFT_1393007 [Cyathus striatus]|nr:hypothetical protein BDQ17DRAFT_1393007 [Cyathus striatus]